VFAQFFSVRGHRIVLIADMITEIQAGVGRLADAPGARRTDSTNAIRRRPIRLDPVRLNPV
jgi:hypothetical protein